MDQGPLVAEQIAAGAKFLVEFNKYRPIYCAFWLKEADSGMWWLYVASEQITDDNFDVAYEEVVDISRTLDDPWFDSIQVKVIGSDDVMAKGVMDLHTRSRGRNKFYLDGNMIGWVSVADVYLYPSPITAST